MKLNAPKVVTWLLALILGIVGVWGELMTVPLISDIHFWLVTAALGLMLLATYFAGL